MRLDELPYRQHANSDYWEVANIAGVQVFRTRKEIPAGENSSRRPIPKGELIIYVKGEGRDRYRGTNTMVAQCVLLELLAEKMKGAGRTTNPAP